jgi:hypothetical protein
MGSKTESSLTATAYHEAGHAVVGWRLYGIRKRGASIIPDLDAGSLGHVHARVVLGGRPDVTPSGSVRLKVENQVIGLLAGAEAQRKYNPRSLRNYGHSSDYQRAIDLLSYFTSGNEELGLYFKLLRLRSRRMVDRLWPAIKAVAAELLIKKSLPGPEISKVIHSALGITPLPEGFGEGLTKAAVSATLATLAKRAIAAPLSTK